jgi:hypothetical protein
MRTAVCIACGLLALLPTSRAQAQTKLAGKMTCAKPDPNYTAPVGDHPNHTMSLGAQKCTWSQGELGGQRLTDETDTFTSDVADNLSHDRGYGVGSLASGDKYFVRFKGTTTLKGEAPLRAECTWKFTGGTGKLKGLTGKGKCTGTFSTDGTSSWDIQGDYKIP